MFYSHNYLRVTQGQGQSSWCGMKGHAKAPTSKYLYIYINIYIYMHDRVS